MNCRFWRTALFSVLYRAGKPNFISSGMSSCLPMTDEARNFQPEIGESLSDTQRQEHVSDQLFSSGTVSSETSQVQENLIEATANASAEGIQLSKRALKRVHWQVY